MIIMSKNLEQFFTQLMIFRTLPLITHNSSIIDDHGLNEDLMVILIKINQNENKILSSEIADELFMDRSKVSRLIDKLVNLGFLTRQHDTKSDRRQVTLNTTTKTIEVLQAFYTERHIYYGDLIKFLGEDRLIPFILTLTSFNDFVKSKIDKNTDGK